MQLFIHYLANLVVNGLREQGFGGRAAVAVGDLFPAFQLAALMVVYVGIGNGNQRVAGAGRVPVLPDYRGGRVCKVVSGADSIVIAAAQYPA